MTHDQGAVASAARDTAVSAAEGRLIVDAVDKVFLLEPTQNPLTTLLTNVGKNSVGQTYKGSSILKASCTNPTFKWFNLILEPF